VAGNHSATDCCENEPSRVAAAREFFFDGLMTYQEFARMLDRKTRVVYLWAARGMPTVRVGRRPYVKLTDAKSWLLRERGGTPQPRRPGRPKKPSTLAR
jgi:hypothetical protein